MTRPRPMLPRRVWRHTTGPYGMYWTPRGEWIVRQSMLRYERNHGPRETIQVEIGEIDRFRIIRSDLP